MNEIATEERLRIVEELNRTANDSLGGESLQRALARITGAEDTSWRGVMRRVAELAYRPTTLQFVACASCGARGDVGLMDAIEARDRWNRGPIQIRAEVA